MRKKLLVFAAILCLSGVVGAYAAPTILEKIEYAEPFGDVYFYPIGDVHFWVRF